MSLKSFLKSIGNFFAGLFKGLKAKAKLAVAIGVELTNAIKKFDVDHPEAADLVTAIIPGTWDDALVAKLRAALPKIMIDLKLAEEVLGKDDVTVLLEGIKAVQSIAGPARTTFLNSLSILIANVTADGEIDLDDLIYLQQWFYKNQHENDIDTTVQ